MAGFNLSRTIAATFALGGAILMMTEPAPSWEGVAKGLLCLLMFTGFSLAAGWKPSAHRKQKGYKLAPSAPVAAEVQELLPSHLPELGTHLKRRRWRGRYQVE
ncbi:hypothetical protein [uncultured Methylobacterium sp.]|uniref:hypothetical protein n=1 Tax=uncultured Methylobacterium sp. TaxID=157278 RepID=UPI0035CAD729